MNLPTQARSHSGAHRRHRRRRGRLLHRLPPRQARPARRRRAGEERPDARLDLARRRPGRAAAQQAQPDAPDAVQRPALRPARGRDRTGDGVEAGRQPAACLLRGALERAQAHGDDGAQLRLRAAHAVAQGGAGEIPADHRSTASSARCSCPTTARSSRPASRWPTRRARGRRRAHRRGRAGHGLRVRRPAHHPRADRSGRHRLRDRGQRRRHLGARRGEDGGRQRPRRRGRAPVHDHREERRHPQGPADAARSRPDLLSEARARRARHRRLGTGHADLRRNGVPFELRPRAASRPTRIGSKPSCCRPPNACRS